MPRNRPAIPLSWLRVSSWRGVKAGRRPVRSNAAELSQADLSAGSIAKIHAVLHSALSHAVRFDLIERNVAKAVKVADSAVEERRVPPSKRYRSSSARRGTTAWGEPSILVVTFACAAANSSGCSGQTCHTPNDAVRTADRLAASCA